MLKKRIAKLEDVPEAHRQFYTPAADGRGFTLTVEEEQDDGKIAEFRNNNIRLQKELEAARADLAKFKDVDPEAYRKAKEAMSKLEAEEERKLASEGKWDDLVARRTAAMRLETERQTKALAEARDTAARERDALRGELAVLRIDSALETELSKVGRLRPQAKFDAASRARRVFTIDAAGQITPTASGSPVYGKKGEPITLAEFASTLLTEAPHLFEPAGGGGSDQDPNEKPRGEQGKRTIKAGDPLAFGRNLKEIAEGRIEVV